MTNVSDRLHRATHDSHANLPWPQARAYAHQAVSPATPVRRPLHDCVGAALAEELRAVSALPPFDTATMDGWAVSGHAPWRVVGRLLAGSSAPDLVPGQAVEVATGARLPSGADAVLRREDGELDAAGLVLSRTPLAPGHDVRPAGEEAQVGDLLLPAGRRVTAPVVGLAAASGHDDLLVRLRPTLDVLVLGDELLHAGLPRDGLVRDALGPQAPSWVAAAGGVLAGVHHVPDSLDATVAALQTSQADIVVTTGGTARGPVDQLHPALAQLGAVLRVDGVAVRPGHPMLLARLPDGRPVVGLPGNPLAAAVAFVSLAVPAVDAHLGLPLARTARAVLDTAVGAPGHAHRLVPCRRSDSGVEPLPHHGPAMLRGLALADVLAVVPPGGSAAGAVVELLDLPWRLRG